LSDTEKEREQVGLPSTQTLNNVASIYCDSGLSMPEAIFCNVHAGGTGHHQFWGINKVVLNDIENIALEPNRNKLLPVGMMLKKKFTKPTTCIIKNKTIQCNITKTVISRHELIDF